jgi:hypothetical protein
MSGFFSFRWVAAIASALVGGLGVFCAVETYYEPEFFLYAVAFLVVALTIGGLRAR